MLFHESFCVKKYFMSACRINCGICGEYPNVSGNQKTVHRLPNCSSKNRCLHHQRKDCQRPYLLNALLYGLLTLKGIAEPTTLRLEYCNPSRPRSFFFFLVYVRTSESLLNYTSATDDNDLFGNLTYTSNGIELSNCHLFADSIP